MFATLKMVWAFAICRAVSVWVASANAVKGFNTNRHNITPPNLIIVCAIAVRLDASVVLMEAKSAVIVVPILLPRIKGIALGKSTKP